MISLKEKIETALKKTGEPNMDKLLNYMEANGFYSCSCASHNHWYGGTAEHVWATYLMARAERDRQMADPDMATYATDEKLAKVCLLHDLCDMWVKVIDSNGKSVSGGHGRKSYWILRNMKVGTPAEQHAVKNHMHYNALCGLKDPKAQKEYAVLHKLITSVDHKASGTAWNAERYKKGLTQAHGKSSDNNYLKAVALDRSSECGKCMMYIDSDYELHTFSNYNRDKIEWNNHSHVVQNLEAYQRQEIPFDGSTDLISAVHKMNSNNKKICIVVGVKQSIPNNQTTRLRQGSGLEQDLLICSNILQSLYDSQKDDEKGRRRYRYGFTMRDEIKKQYHLLADDSTIFFSNATMIRSGEKEGFPFVAPWTIDILMIPGKTFKPFAIYTDLL